MSECFVNSNYIKEIELKANKIYVDDNCFKGATKLQKVLIDGTIVNIKNNCFNNCSSLKFFIVNASLSISIGSQQFIQCNQLNTIKINAANHNYQLKSFELNKDSFKGANNLSILEISGGNLSISNELLNSSSLTELQINSANEVEIESNTFNNSKLKTIYIFSMKLTIKSNCFNNNSKLQNITFICPIINIKNYCFNNINYCKQLEFKNSNQLTFESNDFGNLSLFESNDIINIEFQALEKIYIGPKSFYKLNKLEKIIFFSKQVKIENESFQKCSSLKSIHFISKIVMLQSQNITKTMEPKREKIKNVFIGEKSFNLCEKLEELNITAINEIHFGKECFYDLPKLKTIKLKASNIVYEDNCFYHCQGLTNNTTINKPNEEMLTNIRDTNIERKIEIKKDNREKPNINTLYKFENKFNSFFILGVDFKKKKKDTAFISMFPSRPVTLSDEYIKKILTYCYPQGKQLIPSNNKSKILTGFVFYLGIKEFVGVTLHIQIPHTSNSFVGNDYDRSYPFCVCLVSDDPDIASHFTFLTDDVDSIIDQTGLQNNFDDNLVPLNLKNQEGDCIVYLHARDKDYVALSQSAQSMNFLLPKLFEYYSNKDLKEYIQTDYLLYLTLQTLFSFLSPTNIVKLFFCMICEKKIAFISDDFNKTSFCVIALTNLIKRINIDYGNVFPCFPLKDDNIINQQSPYIFGYNSKCQNDDVDINLDNITVDYSNEAIRLINSFPYLKTLTKNAEKLYNAKLKEIQIPERIELKSEFIQNADHSIYPQCFQYFVHTKCILNDSFIKDFVRLIEKPFFPLLESFIRGFVAT